MPTLADRVRQRMDALHLTMAAATEKAGLKRTFVADLLSGKKQTINGANAAKLAAALECSVDWLLHGKGDVAPSQGLLVRGAGEAASLEPTGDAPTIRPGAEGEVRRADVEIPLRGSMPLDLPIYGTAAGSVIGTFQIDDVVDHARRPAGLVGTRAYGLYVTGESMVPAFRPGDLVVLHPGRPVRIGDIVVVQTRNFEQGPVIAYIKELVRITAEKLFLQQYNPQAVVELDRRVVVSMHRVLSTAELIGL